VRSRADVYTALFAGVQAVTLHTTLGDLKLELYCESVCRSVLWELDCAHKPCLRFEKKIVDVNMAGTLSAGAEGCREFSGAVRQQLL
jgi:hypothetical protein